MAELVEVIRALLDLVVEVSTSGWTLAAFIFLGIFVVVLILLPFGGTDGLLKKSMAKNEKLVEKQREEHDNFDKVYFWANTMLAIQLLLGFVFSIYFRNKNDWSDGELMLSVIFNVVVAIVVYEFMMRTLLRKKD